MVGIGEGIGRGKWFPTREITTREEQVDINGTYLER